MNKTLFLGIAISLVAACSGAPGSSPDAGCDPDVPIECIEEDFTSTADLPRAELPYGDFALITGTDRITRDGEGLGVQGGDSSALDRGEEVRVSFARHADEITIEWAPEDAPIEVRYGDGAVAESLIFDSSPATLARARWLGITARDSSVTVTRLHFCAY